MKEAIITFSREGDKHPQPLNFEQQMAVYKILCDCLAAAMMVLDKGKPELQPLGFCASEDGKEFLVSNISENGLEFALEQLLAFSANAQWGLTPQVEAVNKPHPINWRLKH